MVYKVFDTDICPGLFGMVGLFSSLMCFGIVLNRAGPVKVKYLSSVVMNMMFVGDG